MGDAVYVERSRPVQRAVSDKPACEKSTLTNFTIILGLRRFADMEWAPGHEVRDEDSHSRSCIFADYLGREHHEVQV